MFLRIILMGIVITTGGCDVAPFAHRRRRGAVRRSRSAPHPRRHSIAPPPSIQVELELERAGSLPNLPRHRGLTFLPSWDSSPSLHRLLNFSPPSHPAASSERRRSLCNDTVSTHHLRPPFPKHTVLTFSEDADDVTSTICCHSASCPNNEIGITSPRFRNPHGACCPSTWWLSQQSTNWDIPHPDRTPGGAYDALEREARKILLTYQPQTLQFHEMSAIVSIWILRALQQTPASTRIIVFYGGELTNALLRCLRRTLLYLRYRLHLVILNDQSPPGSVDLAQLTRHTNDFRLCSITYQAPLYHLMLDSLRLARNAMLGTLCADIPFTRNVVWMTGSLPLHCIAKFVIRCLYADSVLARWRRNPHRLPNKFFARDLREPVVPKSFGHYQTGTSIQHHGDESIALTRPSRHHRAQQVHAEILNYLACTKALQLPSAVPPPAIATALTSDALVVSVRHLLHNGHVHVFLVLPDEDFNPELADADIAKDPLN